MNDHAYAALVGGLVAIFVVILLGLYIYFNVVGSISGIGSTGATILTSLNSTTQTVFTLAPIIGIIAIASIMIGIVTKFGQGGA